MKPILIPYNYAIRGGNNLNRFDHGFLVITDKHISCHEWYNYKDNKPGGNGDSVLSYVYVIDGHFITTDINAKAIQVFHSRKEVVEWATRTFIQKIPAKPPKCKLAAYKRDDIAQHRQEILSESRMKYY